MNKSKYIPYNHAKKWVVLDRERVKVDIVILPLVKWLNSITSVKTAFSCAGGNGLDCWVPYVSFYSNQDEARKIETKINEFVYGSDVDVRIELKISYDSKLGRRYRLAFDDRKGLKAFIGFLLK